MNTRARDCTYCGSVEGVPHSDNCPYKSEPDEMKDNDVPEVIYAYKTNDPKYKYYSNDPNAWSGDNIKYILADTSISDADVLEAVSLACDDLRERHKAQLVELEKRLIDELPRGQSHRVAIERYISKTFKEVV